MLIFLLKKSGYRPYTVYRGAVLNNTASGCKLGVYPDTVPSKYLDILEHTAKLYLGLLGNHFLQLLGHFLQLPGHYEVNLATGKSVLTTGSLLLAAGTLIKTTEKLL